MRRKIKVSHSVVIERCPCGQCHSIGLTLLDQDEGPIAILCLPAEAVAEFSGDLARLSNEILHKGTLEGMVCMGTA